MTIFTHQIRKKRLIKTLNSLELRPQAMLINQLDIKSSGMISDQQFLLEVELLLLQDVSQEAASISLGRFRKASQLAIDENCKLESKFLNEYCILYRLYIELLKAKENVL